MAWMPIRRLLKQGTPPAVAPAAAPQETLMSWLALQDEEKTVRHDTPGPPSTPPRRERHEETPQQQSFSAFDAIGQRNELVRVRISQMMERLDDLKSLQADFSQILEPLAVVADELPQAKIRIAELEVLLAREQEYIRSVRRELAEVNTRAATSSNELAAATAELQRLETQLREREAETEELRVRIRDRTVAAENLERQLFAETEQVRTLTGENKSLRIEAQAADQAMTRAERELTDVTERLSLSEHDARRLQALAGEQAVRLSEAEARVGDLSQQLEVFRQRCRDLEAQLSAETAARERGEGQFEAELAANRAERANLSMKLDAASGRAATLEQLLAQVRSQLREREEIARSVDRTMKELHIEKTTLERRLEGLQGELNRQNERGTEIQRQRTEADGRADMLGKALAAKEAAMEQAQTRAAALADRMEHLSRRHEAEKAELQAANRRLVEELQNERSERALAQGALDIARETRASLQKQHETLKRAVRNLHGVDPATMTGLASTEGKSDRAEESNVTPFAHPDREGRDTKPNNDVNA